MYIIGLTGPSGSGKGRVAEVLADLGVAVIDADAVYHSLIKSDTACTRALAAHFGPQVLAADGGVDRQKLADTVFCGDEQQSRRLLQLNTITHHHVLEAIRQRIDQLRNQYDTVVVDAPTLIESGFHRECDTVIAVFAERDIRMARIICRDGLDDAAAARRIDAQPAKEFYLAQASYIIENNGSEQTLLKQTHEVWNALNRGRQSII